MPELNKLNIFVHRASECLTDHESHGDGLICFSLLNGLAERGHQIYAYTNSAPIRQCSPNLHIKTGRHQVPANSLAPWEYSWRAEQWMKELAQMVEFDLIWRMHPYGGNCPAPPRTGGKPLVVGPLFYNWPVPPGETPKSGRPRLGVGLQSLVKPAAERGWQRTLSQAALIVCATESHSALLRRQYLGPAVLTLPVIVEPPIPAVRKERRQAGIALLFVANLVSYKNPQVFVETIQCLRQSGINATGKVLGDGPERASLEAWCRQVGIESALCFQGKVPNTEVYAALAEADFLLSASYGEPYGRSIAEAMSVGTPALCHRSGGPADFIEDGRDGLLVDHLTAKAYAARLEAALSAPDAWNRLSANAARKARNWRAGVVLDRLEKSLYQAARSEGVKERI